MVSCTRRPIRTLWTFPRLVEDDGFERAQDAAWCRPW
jgi:hypothetical protein